MYTRLMFNNCIFLLDRTVSSSAMYFQCLLGGSIVEIKMGESTRSRPDVSASLGLLQYWRVCLIIVYNNVEFFTWR